MSVLTRRPAPATAKAALDRQRLNPLDIALRSVDQTIRGMGYPGFDTQMLVWLSRRIDVGRLRNAIARLAIRHPVVTARLVEPGASAGSYWQFQSDVPAMLHEIDVPTDDEQSVLDCAARLLSRPCPPEVNPPLRFHLLHRPGSQDVLLLQYNHSLMDNSATPLVVKELDHLSQSAGDDDDQPVHEPAKLAARRLRSLSHAARTKATQAAFELQAHTLRGRAAILGTGEEDKPRNVSVQILSRTLEPDLTRALQTASARLCGFPSLSMTILASAFRAIRSLGPESRNADRNYVAGIGLELGLRRGSQALLQNVSSVVPITARPAELSDRNELIRSLTRQMRDRLEAKIDLGVLRLAHAFQRRPRHIRWVLEHMLRWSYSLWYAYFGSLDSIQTLCGVPVERCFYIGPTWSPIGLSLLANLYGGRLHFQAAFDPDLITPPLATQLLDAVSHDLADFGAA